MTEIAEGRGFGAAGVPGGVQAGTIAAGRSSASGAGATGVSTPAGAESAFSKSIVISGIRCTLAYVLIPYGFPLVGFGSGAGPWIGLPVGLVAIAANVVSMARFWRSDHRWKWPVSAINAGVIVLLAFLVAADAGELIS